MRKRRAPELSRTLAPTLDLPLTRTLTREDGDLSIASGGGSWPSLSPLCTSCFRVHGWYVGEREGWDITTCMLFEPPGQTTGACTPLGTPEHTTRHTSGQLLSIRKVHSDERAATSQLAPKSKGAFRGESIDMCAVQTLHPVRNTLYPMHTWLSSNGLPTPSPITPKQL